MSEQKKVFIDRDHFDERVRLAAGPDADEEFSADFLDGVKVVLYMLSTETPADVKPVVSAEWLDGRCTNCTWELPDYEYYGGCEIGNVSCDEFNFCPNCGAKMRGTEK